MSFVRRIFGGKSAVKKVSSATANLSSDALVIDESTKGEVVVEDSQFDADDVDLIDIFRLEKKIVVKKEDLNTKLNKYVKQEKKMVRLQNHIIQMDKELNELRRMLRQVDLKKNALEAEVESKKDEIKELSSFEEKAGMEAEIRRKDPHLFGKYQNIKSKADAKTLLGCLKTKQTTLQHLEMLTFRKYLRSDYEPHKEVKVRSPRNSIRSPPKKTKRATFQTRFHPMGPFPNRFQFPTPEPTTEFQLFATTGSFTGIDSQTAIELHPENTDTVDVDIDGDDAFTDDYDDVDVLSPLVSDV